MSYRKKVLNRRDLKHLIAKVSPPLLFSFPPPFIAHFYTFKHHLGEKENSMLSFFPFWNFFFYLLMRIHFFFLTVFECSSEVAIGFNISSFFTMASSFLSATSPSWRVGPSLPASVALPPYLYIVDRRGIAVVLPPRWNAYVKASCSAAALATLRCCQVRATTRNYEPAFGQYCHPRWYNAGRLGSGADCRERAELCL